MFLYIISHVYVIRKKTGGGHDHITFKNNYHRKGLDHICHALNINNIQYLGVSYISSPFSGGFGHVFDKNLGLSS